jgi:hypothetical protein
MMVWTYGTDKISNGLVPDYERLFAPFRDKPITLLEIGLLHGESARLWGAVFPRGRIVGIDVNLPPVPAEIKERCAFIQCNQNDSAKLLEVAQKYGPFDIIIDDGAHLAAETENCFKVLFSHVKQDGWYVIEDWGISAPMVHAITRIQQSVTNTSPVAHTLPISGYEILLAQHKCLAFFRKGQPWNG